MHPYDKKETENYLGIRNQFPVDNLIDLISNSLPPLGLVYNLGCGDGFGTQFFTKNDVIGIDASSEMIKKAKENYPNDYFVCGEMEKVQLRNASGVVSLFALFHLNTDDQDKLFLRAYDQLNENGVLAFTYLDKNLTKQEGVWNGMMDFGGEKHYGHFPLSEIEENLLDKGFNEINLDFKNGLMDLVSKKGISGVEKINSLVYNITTKGSEIEETLPWVFARK